MSPLSPERACASFKSLSFAIFLSLDRRNNRRNFALGHQRRPIRDYLFDLRTPTAKPGHGWRAVQNQWSDLACESLDRVLVFRANPDVPLYFGDVGRRIARERSMTSVGADELSHDVIELQAEPFEPLSRDPIGCLGLLHRVRPSIYKRTGCFPTGRITDRDFVEVSCGSPLDSGEPHAVGARLLELNSCEVRDTIRSDVLARIAHLVEQLFLY